MRMSSALAYYTVFSLAPVLVIAVAIAGWMFGREAVSGQLQRQLVAMMGNDAAEVVGNVVASASAAKTGTWATVLGIAALIVGASGAFLQLQHALNKVWGEEKPEIKGFAKFLRRRVLSFGMVLALGFLLAVSMLLTAVTTAISTWAGERLSVSPAVMEAGNLGMSLVVIAALFAAIYKILPDAKVAWSDVWGGAIVGSVGFAVGKSLVGAYLGYSSVASTFGAAAAPVVLLAWVFWSANALLVGAEFSHAWAKVRGSRAP